MKERLYKLVNFIISPYVLKFLMVLCTLYWVFIFVYSILGFHYKFVEFLAYINCVFSYAIITYAMFKKY